MFQFKSYLLITLCCYIFLVFNDIFLYSFDLLFLTKVFFFFFSFLVLSTVKLQRNFYILLFLSIFFIFFGFLFTFLKGTYNSYSIGHSISIATTLIFPLLSVFSLNILKDKIGCIVKAIIFSALFASFWKFLFIISSEWYPSLINILYPKISGRGMQAGLENVNTGNQMLILISFILVALLYISYSKEMLKRLGSNSRFLSKGFLLVCLLVLYANALLSGSVFFIIMSTVILYLMILFLTKNPLFRYFLFTLGTIGFIYIIYFISQWIIELRGEGFLSGVSIRLEQFIALFEEVLKSPFFGHGFGYFIESYLRNHDVLYLYEIQTVSAFMHFGILGVLMMVAILSMVFFSMKNLLSLRAFVYLMILMCGASLLNPYLFGTYASVSYFLIFLISYLYQKNKYIGYN
ncbi:hypothetical protein GJQ54_09150 [Oceanospirillaceae bacterium ASx5O]|nr:hypothetical protein GJQ54_09150 [Oceanospirillaceae bacterium ASx5O]